MSTVFDVTRLICLAVLFGGSSAIVFGAVVLVHAAKANGIPVEEAAATNAPLFIQFSKVAAVCALGLVLSEHFELIKKSKLKQKTKLGLAQYAASLICAIAIFVFAFVIVPPMDRLQGQMKQDPAAHAEFKKLHDTSRLVFGLGILGALISLVLPCFASRRPLPISEKQVGAVASSSSN